MAKKSLNRRATARLISQQTGFTIEDIETVLAAEDYVYAEAIRQGVSIKSLKLFKIDIEVKKAKQAYNGFDKTYFEVPEKRIIKFKPLSQLTQALEELNASYEEDNDPPSSR